MQNLSDEDQVAVKVNGICGEEAIIASVYRLGEYQTVRRSGGSLLALGAM